MRTSEIVCAFFEALGAGQSGRVEPFLAADVHHAVYGDGTLEPPFSGIFVGRDAVAAHLSRISAAFQHERFTVRNLTIDGTRAAANVEVLATHRPTQTRVTGRGVHFLGLKDGLVREWDAYLSPAVTAGARIILLGAVDAA